MLLLSNHSPIWYHHYQIVAIPLCWLAAYCVPLFETQSTVATDAGPRRTAFLPRIGPLIAMGLVLLVMYSRVKATVPYYNQRVYDTEVVALLQRDVANTTWVFADQAIYPFYAHLPVPPEIAVFSRKRFFGETLSNRMLVDILDRYHPEQILLTRFKDELLSDPEFVGYLNAHYTTVQENINYGYYQLNR